MIIIGKQDRVDLPDLELENVGAKIDTGADGCVLHCHSIKLIKVDQNEIIEVKLLDPKHKSYCDKTIVFDEFDKISVKNSGGSSEHRFRIKTKITLFGRTRTARFSLTDRSDMAFPILLGRKFLAKNYLVDVELKNESYKDKIKYQ